VPDRFASNRVLADRSVVVAGTESFPNDATLAASVWLILWTSPLLFTVANILETARIIIWRNHAGRRRFVAVNRPPNARMVFRENNELISEPKSR